MKGLARSVLLLLLLCGCAPAGLLSLDQPHTCTDEPNCASAFPQGKWQFVHLIEFRLPDGTGSTVIGITVLDGTAIKCALTTTEGMTLFQATDNGRLKIIHALPPFDKPGFAAGLMGDVRAILLRPPGTPRCGLFDNKPGCRFQDENTTTEDAPLVETAVLDWNTPVDQLMAAGLSSSPPCPGMIFPESFCPANLLSMDSTKSPDAPKTAASTPIIIQSHKVRAVANSAMILAATIAKNIPPNNPSQVFFGEIRGNNLCLPNLEPTK